MIGELFKDLAVPDLVGPGQIAAGDTLAEAKVISIGTLSAI